MFLECSALQTSQGNVPVKRGKPKPNASHGIIISNTDHNNLLFMHDG